MRRGPPPQCPHLTLSVHRLLSAHRRKKIPETRGQVVPERAPVSAKASQLLCVEFSAPKGATSSLRVHLLNETTAFLMQMRAVTPNSAPFWGNGNITKGVLSQWGPEKLDHLLVRLASILWRFRILLLKFLFVILDRTENDCCKNSGVEHL